MSKAISYFELLDVHRGARVLIYIFRTFCFGQEGTIKRLVRNGFSSNTTLACGMWRHLRVYFTLSG